MKRFYQKLNRQILMMYYLRFQMSWHLLKIWSQTYQYFWHMVCLNIANGKVRTPPRSTRSCFLLKTAIQFLKVLHSLCFNKINIFQVPHCHNLKKVTFYILLSLATALESFSSKFLQQISKTTSTTRTKRRGTTTCSPFGTTSAGTLASETFYFPHRRRARCPRSSRCRAGAKTSRQRPVRYATRGSVLTTFEGGPSKRCHGGSTMRTNSLLSVD